MKKIHPGEICLEVSGNVTISGGSIPEIKVNDKSLAKYIAESIDISKEQFEEASFLGDVSLVVECKGTEPEIQNTMTNGENDAPEPEIEDIPLNWGNAAGRNEECANLS